jgi:hypothetical protein
MVYDGKTSRETSSRPYDTLTYPQKLGFEGEKGNG